MNFLVLATPTLRATRVNVEIRVHEVIKGCVIYKMNLRAVLYFFVPSKMMHRFGEFFVLRYVHATATKMMHRFGEFFVLRYV